ncbi:hypothetical protein R9C00_27405 [Flammeovirgaceae bacterium SG7u.111]|nr:hypothetical protein [Flammeovirgaceae bacterium SG7u.132]WPO35427.1 hypothetical protein R9C00_27405 [Flammeovirgaceae bacterium SG7u.111]
MKTFQLLCITLAMLVASSCVPKKEHEQLKSELDAMRETMDERDGLISEMDGKMDSIGILLDSIEVAEESIVLNLEQGIPYDDYVSRLAKIQDYMQRTNQELSDMENALVKSNSNNKVYQKMIANYKRIVAEKDATITQLNEKIATYEQEKEALVKTVDLQNDELDALQRVVEQKEKEIITTNEELDSTQVESTKAAAQKYFALGQSTEELASKTSSLFNSKKKKAYYRKAHDYYKQAFELDGELTDAFKKMEELSEKIQ